MKTIIDDEGRLIEGSPVFLGDIGEAVTIPPESMARFPYRVRARFYGCPDCRRLYVAHAGETTTHQCEKGTVHTSVE